ncbi:DUF4145 domain-containing protein [Kaistella sp. DKR-2]|uniref:DUF4145 domain-containing protein n=1 Tax=Kaistella soli TaxID=2849654 RepID=UPI001C258EF0|nr:DUF4145 domain-containing protein [Kaistella soli]MBU8883835.1 DUF4145 domain-containing protein [Kaistella soli]
MKNKYFCKSCKGVRNHEIIFDHKVSGEEEDYDYQWIKKYRVIQCLGCENISFLYIFGDNQMIRHISKDEIDYYEEDTIYPYFIEKGNEISAYHLPSPIKEIYVETISAFKADALILTAGGFRAIIEALCNFLKIKKGNLEERINLLHNKGHLTLSESKRLHSIRFLGNDALHEIEKPKKAQLEILLEIINHLLSNLFINDKIIKGQIETVIDDYKDFKNLLQRKITKEMLKKDFLIDDFLGKSRRLITKENLKKFLVELNNEINNKEIVFLEIVDVEKEIYKVIGEPELSFFWDL